MYLIPLNSNNILKLHHNFWDTLYIHEFLEKESSLWNSETTKYVIKSAINVAAKKQRTSFHSLIFN